MPEFPLPVLFTLYVSIPVLCLAVLGLLGTWRMEATAPLYRDTAHYGAAGRMLVGVILACVAAPFIAYALDVYLLAPALERASNALVDVPLDRHWLAGYGLGLTWLAATAGKWWNRSLERVAHRFALPRHRRWRQALRFVQGACLALGGLLIAAVYNGLV